MAAFTLNLADLQFVLKQIKIAEAHANGILLTEIRIDPRTGEVIAARNQYNVDGEFVGSNAFPPTDVDGNRLVYTLAIPDPHTPYGLRTVDGTYNNLVWTAGRLWGAAGQPMPRTFDAGKLCQRRMMAIAEHADGHVRPTPTG